MDMDYRHGGTGNYMGCFVRLWTCDVADDDSND